jgi:hypothetical protein
MPCHKNREKIYITDEQEDKDLSEIITQKKIKIFDYLLDMMIERNGIIETLTILLEGTDLTYDELINMGFLPDDIQLAVEETQ